MYVCVCVFLSVCYRCFVHLKYTHTKVHKNKENQAREWYNT